MSRTERMKSRHRMQRRIRLVVEERRMALAPPPPIPLDPDPHEPIPQTPSVAAEQMAVEPP